MSSASALLSTPWHPQRHSKVSKDRNIVSIPELVARTRTTELKVFAGSKVLCDLFLKLALPHLSGAILLVGTRENIERTLREG